MKKIQPLLTLAIAMLGLSSFAQTKTGFHVLNRFQIGGNGGWDYITADADGKRLFVSHGTQVNILSMAGDSIGVISNTNGVHGIALAPPFGKGYTSNGRDNTCTAFDLKTYKILGVIPAGTNPDAIFYEAFSKKIYAFNGRSLNATVIDPATDKVVATIQLGGKPETGVSDGKGHVFVNSETTNEVVVINANTYQVEHRYKIENGEEPSGLAMDVATNRLFIGCGGNQTMVIMDASTGKNLAKFAIGNCDGVAFDPALKQAYSSNGEGTLSIVKELSADKFELLETIPTEASARTIGIDIKTHLLYLPAAKTEPVTPTAANARIRPKQLPGSFHVLVVGK